MIGKTLGHFEVLEKLGAGGMGEIYRARDSKLQRDVAIKILPPDLARDPERRARFEREASAVAALQHPNIVTIHAVEEAEGVHFIAMELIDGRTLRELIPDDGLDLQPLLDIAIPLTDALSSAHAKGIVHRDIKPANVMLDSADRVKVLDFGLAKAVMVDSDSDDTVSLDAHTKAGQLLGTVAYMSPEQAEGRAVDARSDVFSLGIVLYEMATGKHPFESDSIVATLSAILKDTPTPIAERAPSLSAFGTIVERCLEKSPDRRYASADALCEDLRQLQSQSSLDRMAPARPPSLLATLRRPVIAVPAALAVLAVIFGAYWFIDRSNKQAWARTEALPEIERLLDDTPWTGGPGFWHAFKLGQEAEQHLQGDPLLERLQRRYQSPMTIRSRPPGATVFAKPYAIEDSEWERVGTTPIDTLPFALGVLEIKLEHTDHETMFDLYWNLPLYDSDGPGYELREHDSTPEGMTWVSAGAPRLHFDAAPAGLKMPGLEQVPLLELGDFLVDRYEVTNRDFKAFVDAGGYQDARYWTQPFVEGGRTLTFEQGIARLSDRTQRPGPAGWEVGDYADGTGDLPVTGISWYEADAYARFMGKSLPTIYHWDRIALTWASGDIVPRSNLSGRELLPAGGTRAPNRFGTHDVAGNAREWCANATTLGERFILGGGWNDPAYAFNDAYAQSPWDRSETNGFRCIQFVDTSVRSDALQQTIEMPFRDFMRETPVSDATFAGYSSQYRYDKSPLNAAIAATLETDDYVRERIDFDAAYGGERMSAYLFLPKGGAPPYQTAILFPGSNALHARSSEKLAVGGASFLLQSGRAILWPIYKSTYERGDELTSDIPDDSNLWREHVVMWAKDLMRSIDYLETRDDIASDQLFYIGFSWGGMMGPLMMAVEDRFKAGIAIVAGLPFQRPQPEVDYFNYLPRVTIPVLILNGKYDFFFPYETAQLPYYELLGTAPEDKRLVAHEGGHAFPRAEMARESLDWLDRYLGPAQ